MKLMFNFTNGNGGGGKIDPPAPPIDEDDDMINAMENMHEAAADESVDLINNSWDTSAIMFAITPLADIKIGSKIGIQWRVKTVVPNQNVTYRLALYEQYDANAASLVAIGEKRPRTTAGDGLRWENLTVQPGFTKIDHTKRYYVAFFCGSHSESQYTGLTAYGETVPSGGTPPIAVHITYPGGATADTDEVDLVSVQFSNWSKSVAPYFKITNQVFDTEFPL